MRSDGKEKGNCFGAVTGKEGTGCGGIRVGFGNLGTLRGKGLTNLLWISNQRNVINGRGRELLF